MLGNFYDRQIQLFFFLGNKQRVKHIPVIERRSGGDEIADHYASACR